VRKPSRSNVNVLQMGLQVGGARRVASAHLQMQFNGLCTTLAGPKSGRQVWAFHYPCIGWSMFGQHNPLPALL
jgi:hypothetical protein